MNNSADDRSAAMAAHGRSSQFASNWLVGCGPVTRATRRRLLAVLRLAHSVLGTKSVASISQAMRYLGL